MKAFIPINYTILDLAANKFNIGKENFRAALQEKLESLDRKPEASVQHTEPQGDEPGSSPTKAGTEKADVPVAAAASAKATGKKCRC